MSFEFDEPEVVESNWLRNPGTYHFVVMDQDPQPASNDGTPLNGLKLTLGVFGGTDPSQINKTWDVILFRGSDGDTENQRKTNNSRLNRFFLAVGLKKHDLKPGEKVVIQDTSLAVQRQFIAEVTQWTDRSGKARLSFSYDRIYHVDDPAVAGVPKNAEALQMIPAELRRPASSFTPAGNQGGGTSVTAAAAPKKLSPADLLSGTSAAPARASAANI